LITKEERERERERERTPISKQEYSEKKFMTVLN